MRTKHRHRECMIKIINEFLITIRLLSALHAKKTIIAYLVERRSYRTRSTSHFRGSGQTVIIPESTHVPPICDFLNPTTFTTIDPSVHTKAVRNPPPKKKNKQQHTSVQPVTVGHNCITRTTSKRNPKLYIKTQRPSVQCSRAPRIARDHQSKNLRSPYNTSSVNRFCGLSSLQGVYFMIFFCTHHHCSPFTLTGSARNGAPPKTDRLGSVGLERSGPVGHFGQGRSLRPVFIDQIFPTTIHD